MLHVWRKSKNGNTLKVHIQNLVIPADDRRFRNLDTKHANCLKQFYENQQICHTILIGNIVSDVTTNKDNLSKLLLEPGKVAVETLGGNHTRHALQCLSASQTKPISTLTCLFYNKLPDELVLQLGYEHNASYTLGKPTSLVDLVNVFRKGANKNRRDTDISGMQSSEVKQWKDISCTILGMNRRRKNFITSYEVKYDLDKFIKDLPLKYVRAEKKSSELIDLLKQRRMTISISFKEPSITKTVVQTGVRPAGLSIDSANNHLYWSDTDKQTVSRCNLDGTHVTVLTTLATPFVIRLDVKNSPYWFANIIDTNEQILYWIGSNGDIKSAKDDGSHVKTILSTNNRDEYYAIGVFAFSGTLLYSNSISIIEFDIGTSNATVLVEQVQSIVFALDYDYTNRYVYLPRFDKFDIVRFPYPSTNIKLQIIIATDPHPTGIAVDSVNEHIYWVTYGALSRSNLDGTNKKTVSTSLSVPWVIRLDFLTGTTFVVGIEQV
ncbi:unnamed protein product [Mytilus edulis]|uniref:Uncharacterized protein n=1 Tax=Mytilus edulis TaxID=6550 RepID=A0A8S3V230_MYTED|nr:unnamed protein product [Mytilus edulis]